MGYAQNLIGLLAPLGVYNLREESCSGACIQALGEEMDAVMLVLEQGLRESCVATALDEGLAIWERTLGGPVQPHVDGRRLSIQTRLYSDTVACSGSAMERTLSACGIDVMLSIEAGGQTIVVQCATIPEETSAERALIEAVLPAHLAVRYELAPV